MLGIKLIEISSIFLALFAIIDVIDDDPQARWLSVCFYGDMITDPEGRGEVIPGGLAGADEQSCRANCISLNPVAMRSSIPEEIHSDRLVYPWL